MKINDLLFSYVCVVVCFGCDVSVSFCKAEKISIYIFIHTIQLTLTVSKLHQFFCVLPVAV